MRGLMLLMMLVLLGGVWEAVGAAPAQTPTVERAKPDPSKPLMEVLNEHVRKDPFSLFATVMFLCAIIHTFLASKFMRLAHHFEHQHRQRLIHAKGKEAGEESEEVSFKAELFHFLGEIEAIFGLWVLPLFGGMVLARGWDYSVHYLDELNFTEPLFVLVIMAMAASRPVLVFAEMLLAMIAGIGKKKIVAWWLSILTVGPLLGSFITEPAAMTICALLLSRKFYQHGPGPGLAYATLGLLFVNVSIGGTLTHFAAPPVLMVAGKWGWTLPFMMANFGWKSALAILGSNVVMYLIFRKQFKLMEAERAPEPDKDKSSRVPATIIFVHLFFLAWTVRTNHYPPLFMGAFLFFLAFTQATGHHQNPVSLKGPVLVAFFLAGLVVHGGLQAWWIEPILGRLSEVPLFFGALVLTAFNDNAAITYLASFVEGFSPTMKYAVVAGAVAGGGLTVIANAPNPAGLTILSKHFPDSVSPLKLLVGALLPTAIAALCFLLLP